MKPTFSIFIAATLLLGSGAAEAAAGYYPDAPPPLLSVQFH